MEDPFDTLRRYMRNAGGGPASMGPHAGGGSGEWRPQVDVYETDDSLVVVMELAGVTPEEIEIQIEGRRLYLKGSRAPALRRRAKRIHHLEIQQGHFHVAIDLPVTVDSSRADAVSHNGLLEVVLPFPRPFHPTVEGDAPASIGKRV